jgi:hypothetical protein
LPAATLRHPAAAFFLPGCSANLRQRARMNILQVSGSFWIRPEFVKLAAAARSTDRVHTSRTYVFISVSAK